MRATRALLPLLLLSTLAAAPAKHPAPKAPKGTRAPKGSPDAGSRDAGSPTPQVTRPPGDVPRVDPGDGGLIVNAVPRHLGGETRCGGCHDSSGWTQVKFNHDRTGFPLHGQHARTSCRSCHVGGFDQPLPRTCAGCHEDPHTGDVGARCEDCHEDTGWRSSFGIDAHRRSGFPLLGAHGALPCLECHPDSRERRFARPAVGCAGCHEADRSRTAGTALDHDRLALSGACNDCHGSVQFSPARFPDHDSCFVISGGVHSAFSCLECHLDLPATVTRGNCATMTAGCTRCHQCSGPGSTLPTDVIHADLTRTGYVCADRKCFECHREAR